MFPFSAGKTHTSRVVAGDAHPQRTVLHVTLQVENGGLAHWYGHTAQLNWKMPENRHCFSAL